jgi:hypothetical protein
LINFIDGNNFKALTGGIAGVKNHAAAQQIVRLMVQKKLTPCDCHKTKAALTGFKEVRKIF